MSRDENFLDRVRRLEDEAAIRSTVDDYVYALDARRWTDLGDVFVANAVLDCAGLDYRDPGRDGRYHGRVNILEGFFGSGRAVNPAAAGSPTFRTGHLATNVRIRLTGDTATSQAYFWEVVNDVEVISGLYRHSFIRCPDRWRIAYLHIGVLFRGRLAGADFGGSRLAYLLDARLAPWSEPDLETP